jgi:hypothetical protein
MLSRALWFLSIGLVAVFLLMLFEHAPGNLIAGVAYLGVILVIGTMLAAGLEHPGRS